MIKSKPASKPQAKHLLWKVGLYLIPFAFALVLLKWGSLFPAGAVIVFAAGVVSLFVVAGFLHIREIGFSKSFHEHPVAHVSAIVLCCCLGLGTGMYLFMRAPQIKPAIAEKGPQQSPAPSASATSSPDFPPAPTPAIVTLAEERRRNEIASGYIHQWTITHPSGPDWHSPEGIAWINRQLKKKNEPFTVTANKVPLAAVNAGNTPAIIRGLVTANSPIGIIANGAGSTVTGNTQVNFPPPATATAPTAQPPAINIAPGGFATSGGYLDHPTIINPKPAPPEVVGLSQTYLAPVPPFVAPPTEAERMQKAIQYNQSLGFERANKEMTSAPGLTLAFGVSAPFVDPAFSVQCAHCVVTSTSVHAGDGSGSFRATNGLPSVLTPDVDVVITVRSTDQTPVTDVTVTPRPTPQ